MLQRSSSDPYLAPLEGLLNPAASMMTVLTPAPKTRPWKKRLASAETATASSPDTSDSEASDDEKISVAGSFYSMGERRAACVKLPSWLSLEGTDNFKESLTGAFGDVNTWSHIADNSKFMLRGESFLENGKKVAAPSSAFVLHQVRVFRTKAPLFNIAQRLPSLKAFLNTHPDHYFMVYNRVIPSSDGTFFNFVTLLVRRLDKNADPAFDRLFNRFVSEGEDFRNARLKYMCRFPVAPAVVQNCIWQAGGEKPVIIGTGYLDQRHYSGGNFIEVDVDISSSRTVSMTVGKVLLHTAKVVMEEMIAVEGQSADELPERPLASFRWIRVNPDIVACELDEAFLLDTC